MDLRGPLYSSYAGAAHSSAFETRVQTPSLCDACYPSVPWDGPRISVWSDVPGNGYHRFEIVCLRVFAARSIVLFSLKEVKIVRLSYHYSH